MATHPTVDASSIDWNSVLGSLNQLIGGGTTTKQNTGSKTSTSTTGPSAEALTASNKLIADIRASTSGPEVDAAVQGIFTQARNNFAPTLAMGKKSGVRAYSDTVLSQLSDNAAAMASGQVAKYRADLVTNANTAIAGIVNNQLLASKTTTATETDATGNTSTTSPSTLGKLTLGGAALLTTAQLVKWLTDGGVDVTTVAGIKKLLGITGAGNDVKLSDAYIAKVNDDYNAGVTNPDSLPNPTGTPDGSYPDPVKVDTPEGDATALVSGAGTAIGAGNLATKAGASTAATTASTEVAAVPAVAAVPEVAAGAAGAASIGAGAINTTGVADAITAIEGAYIAPTGVAATSAGAGASTAAVAGASESGGGAALSTMGAPAGAAAFAAAIIAKLLFAKGGMFGGAADTADYRNPQQVTMQANLGNRIDELALTNQTVADNIGMKDQMLGIALGEFNSAKDDPNDQATLDRLLSNSWNNFLGAQNGNN